MPQIELPDAHRLPRDHPALVPDFWTKAMLCHPSVPPGAVQSALAAAACPSETDLSHPLQITQRHEAVIIDTLVKTLGDPRFAAQAGVDQVVPGGSVLTYILFCAPTVLDMAKLLCRYLPITRIKSRATLEQHGDVHHLIIWQTDPQISEIAAYQEFAVGSVLHALRKAVNLNLTGESLRLSGQSGLPASELAQIYGCPVEIGAEKASIVLPNSALALKVQGADGQLLTHLQSYGDILLERRGQDGRSTTHLLEEALTENLPRGTPTLPDIARSMGLGARTLSRRLADEGTTFRDVLVELRFDLARHYLEDPRLSLAEIAFLLGFADQSSFGTAFRRWSGLTPGQFRLAL